MHRTLRAWLAAVMILLLVPTVAWAHVGNASGRSTVISPLSRLLSTRIYVVKPGDTLWSLSIKLGETLSNLVRQNGIRDPNVLHIGQKLRYHGASARVAPAVKPVKPAVKPVARSAAKPAAKAATLSGRSAGNLLPANVVELHCLLTAYTAGPHSTGKWPGDPGYDLTSTGVHAVQGVTVAVDPSVIPYGTKLYIPGIGFRIAQDTGGAIVGDHIDVFYSDEQTAIDFGAKYDRPVYVLPSAYSLPQRSIRALLTQVRFDRGGRRP